jgi:hypothetical protein
MQRYECQVTYGDPQFLTVTVEQPDVTATYSPRNQDERAEMQSFAESWSKALTPADFKHHLNQFSVLNFAESPPAASSVWYKFTVRPVTDPASTRKLGFRRKNPVRRFDKRKSAVTFVDEIKS